jgi:hypothetical protein
MPYLFFYSQSETLANWCTFLIVVDWWSMQFFIQQLMKQESII